MSEKMCKHCGKKPATGYKYCAACAEKTKHGPRERGTKFCAECGKPLSHNSATYCPPCSKQVRRDQQKLYRAQKLKVNRLRVSREKTAEEKQRASEALRATCGFGTVLVHGDQGQDRQTKMAARQDAWAGSVVKREV